MTGSPKVSTTLWFDKDAEAAAHHYIRAIPGSEILGIERYGKAGPGPEGSVMLVRPAGSPAPFTASSHGTSGG